MLPRWRGRKRQRRPKLLATPSGRAGRSGAAVARIQSLHRRALELAPMLKRFGGFYPFGVGVDRGGELIKCHATTRIRGWVRSSRPCA